MSAAVQMSVWSWWLRGSNLPQMQISRSLSVQDYRRSIVGKVGSNGGNFNTGKPVFYANSADYPAELAAILAMGVPLQRLLQK